MMRTLLTGADVVLPDRVAAARTLVLEADRIVDVLPAPVGTGGSDVRVDLSGQLVVPGFVDVHVHGVAGTDTLDGPGAIAAMARRLPSFGVTAFCPTTVACGPEPLAACLAEIRALRAAPPAGAARVLPAHLESNFINPEYAGAQPRECLRRPSRTSAAPPADEFPAAAILDLLDACRADVGIVTLAPELDGGLDLVRHFAAQGVRVSIGHSGASFDQAQSAFAAGVRHATHLFNAMRPMHHRDPGVVGAILHSPDVAAEVICDGHHVHPAAVGLAIAAKGTSGIIAITDGTAASGLERGATARLGSRPVIVAEVARLVDGTMAGSVLTMDRAFAFLVTECGLDPVSAATLCSTTPARELGLSGLGVIAPGALADLTVLDSRLRVVATWVGGRRVWPVLP